MKLNHILLGLTPVFMAGFLTAKVPEMTTSPVNLPVIPQPAVVKVSDGNFTFNPQTVIIAGLGAEPEARLFARQVAPAMGIEMDIEETLTTPRDKNIFSLGLDPDLKELGKEGYRLHVMPERIELSAYRPAGLFYGCQTIRQLLPAEVMGQKTAASIEWALPCATIEDSPRFGWRGHLLDTARHFFTVDEIKRAIDLIALHKMNVFHWHLVDDQGWRLEIKRYPKLTETGAWRKTEEGGRYGGFYTQDEVRDIVAYAAERHVTVVPEIEMPGHSVAVLASYPQLGCTGGPYEVRPGWGISKEVYCAGQEQTYQFIFNVLDEVLALFPSQYIHIGGDECPKDSWSSCPKCQNRIKEEKLADEKELQSYFVRRIDKYLDERGRRLVGWDEILEGGLASGAVVQAWRQRDDAKIAAADGHDVIVSHTSHCYLDYTYEKISVEHAYSYDPIPAGLTDEQASHVLGIEGNSWTEHIPDQERYDYQTFPRLSALAEVAWSQPQRRSWESFSSRLDELKRRLGVLGVNYGAK